MQLVGYIDYVGSPHYAKLSLGEAANLANAEPGDEVTFLGMSMMVEWTCSDGRLRLIDRHHGTSYEVDCYPDEAEASRYAVAA